MDIVHEILAASATVVGVRTFGAYSGSSMTGNYVTSGYMTGGCLA